jgi:hypothetical protein
MNIKIDETCSLKSDPRNVILVENKTSQEGNEYETTIGYFGTVESALKGYLQYKVNTSKATSITQLIDEINGCKKIIEKTLRGQINE